MDVLDIRIEKINIPPRLREVDPAAVKRLADSIRQIGMKQPISVRLAKSAVTESGEPVENKPLLVAGRHRLEALKLLGRSHAPCVEVSDDGLLAELWEIDENLIRSELTPAQTAHHLKRRKELWTELFEGGKTLPTSATGQTAQFASATEEATGRTKRSINGHVARADALGDDLLSVQGTSLDKGVELDALATMEPEQRQELIAKARNGEKVSARHLREYAVNESRAEKLAQSALCGAWNRAPEHIRAWFLGEIGVEEIEGCTQPLIDWQ